MSSTVLMNPPDDGSRNTVVINDRTYTSAPGATVVVPQFDSPALEANGWYVVTQASGSGASSATISTIPGLSNILANGGWQVLSDRPQVQNNSGAYKMSSCKTNATNCYTNRTKHRAMFAATHIVLVYANYGKQNALVEAPGNNRVRVKAAVQKFGTSFTDETPVSVPAKFNGNMFGECAQDGLLFSDPIAFDVGQNEIFFVRTSPYVAGASYYVQNDMGTAGGTGPGALGNGEGSIVGDLAYSGTIGSSFDSNYFSGLQTGGPIAVLGFNAAPQKTCAIIGDSISYGNFDYGHSVTGRGGWLRRLMCNWTTQQITPSQEQTTIGNFPYMIFSQGGQAGFNYATRGLSSKTFRLAEFASTWIWEAGINDIYWTPPQSLAQLKTTILTVAGMAASRGKKLIVCTLTPYTISTDYFTTIGGQTPGANDSVRIAYNNWLRDISAAGFIAQAAAVTGASASSFAIWDTALTIEFNSNGTPLTLTNGQQAAGAGGYWPAALNASITTSTITGNPGMGGFADTTQSMTQDQYKGYAIRMTSGASNGQTANIACNTATAFTFGTNLSVTPAIGDSYTLFNPYVTSLIQNSALNPGVHPTALGHMIIANRLAAMGALALIQ